MSHYYLKTEYQEEEFYSGGMDYAKHKLYAWHNNGCDIVSIRDENGDTILSFNDTVDNNILSAINRLVWAWDDARTNKLTEGVDHMTNEERGKIFK
jgi:hypothetical protein